MFIHHCHSQQIYCRGSTGWDVACGDMLTMTGLHQELVPFSCDTEYSLFRYNNIINNIKSFSVRIVV